MTAETEFLNKRLDKLEEILTANGFHLSYFNKNLDEIKVKLDKQDETTEKNAKVVEAHIKRTEPAVITFERLSWAGKAVIAVALGIAALAGGIAGYKAILKDLLSRSYNHFV